jgi:hypothetical protein
MTADGTPMTPAQRMLLEACCARSAECWSAGHDDKADGWFNTALDILGGCSFIDLDEGADR